MTPQNHDFNAAMYAIVTTLHKALPFPVTLDTASLIETGNLLPSEQEERARRQAVCAATIDYLQAEGLVRYQERSPCGQRYGGVLLTGKALAALGQQGGSHLEDRLALQLFR